MMRTLAHISDLHFGTVQPPIAEALVEDLNRLNPSLLAVSGDLTQRGRRRQYQQAQRYLERLPRPQLVIPGNHDIPLYDVLRRFLWPLTRYRRYITANLRPFYCDEEMAVLGLNTARSFTWKGGRISEEQLLEIRQRLCSGPAGRFRILVTHHPFIPAPSQPRADVVGGAQRALAVMEECGVDVVLSGHLHLSYSGELKSHHAAARHSILSIHAGTATSSRRRGGEPNGYNLITLLPDALQIAVRAWTGGRFEQTALTRYARNDNQWIRQS